MTMPRLGRAGIPAIGLGSWRLEGPTCVERVQEALDMGYSHIDTAEMYGNEEQVGEGIRSSPVPREDVFVTTKVSPEHLSPSEVERAAEGSLRRLRSDYLDLLLIHWPSPNVPLEKTLEAMEKLCEQEKARFIGVSNFPTRLWERALAIAPDIVCNQVEYHLFLGQEPLVQMARERRKALIAYCPLAQGRVLRNPLVQEIARRHERTPAQVALRWLVQQERVAAIPKTARRRHMEENVQIFDFELSEAEMDRLSGLDRGERLIDPAWAPDWD